MIHDFETLVSRKNTGSGKWDEMTKEHPNLPENVAPLSIADMELKNPPEIVEGLKKYIDTHILGYTGPTEEYFDAVCGWMKRRNDWNIKKEEIVSTHGVVTVLAVSVLAYTDPGDGVITMPPVYYPFRMTIEHNNRKNVECPLINTNETYTIDFDLFEKLCAEEKNKMFI
ncbi:aminotransferase class I/II-fold pyridoxal phosphate-dependent enzyme, partial [Hominenteromicrobium sp.]